MPRGKYTGDATTVKTILEISMEQLEDAIELFLAENYVSAITLAGASDAIFSGVLEKKGLDPISVETWKDISEVRENTGLSYGGDFTRKELFHQWNNIRNRLKHYNGEKDKIVLEFFPEDDAYEAIRRSLAGADKVGLEPRNKFDFDKYVIPKYHM